MISVLKEGERFDELQRNGYKIIQNTDKFCFGMDAVLLSGFAKVRKGEFVLDVGTGTGIIPILLEAKTEGEHFTGLEIQAESADMACRSVKYNGLERRIRIVCGDIKEGTKLFSKSTFDVITSNPPYMNQNHGLKNPNMPKAIARHEIMCTLEDIISQGSVLLKPSGRLYMVYRPHRLIELVELCSKYKLEVKRIKMVHPYVDKEANMVLVEAIRGGKPWLKVEKPLIVYQAENIYTDEITEIYGY